MEMTSVSALLHDGDRRAWQLAALATALRTPGDSSARAAAQDVLRALGLGELDLRVAGASPQQLASQAAAPLLQAAAVATGNAVSWADQRDEALLAQGRASGRGARMFVEQALPNLGDLGRRLTEPGARMLDVGTGVAALAVAYAEALPGLHVVGIDVFQRALGLAARTVADSPAGERVELRCVDIADLQDVEGFDLAWVPAPFIPEAPLRRGLARVAAVLRPDGWIMLGHGKYGSDPVDDALDRFKTVLFGGTPLDDAQAEAVLAEAGFDGVIHAPTPPGAPAITLAHRR